MLSLLKSHDDVFDRIVGTGISKELLAAFLEARRLDGNFKARRRIERHIVNLMRMADESEREALSSLINDPEKFQAAHEKAIRDWIQRLFDDPNALAQFIAERPHIDVQHFRVLIRNAKKHLNTTKTAPMAKLKSFLLTCID